MQKKIEQTIVKAFFQKRVQDRMLYELASETKRDTAIGRLAHGFENVLKTELMIEIKKPNSDPAALLNLLKKHGAGDSCYVIAWNPALDSKVLPLQVALETVVGNGQPVLISCLHGKLSYFEAEQEIGPPPRFILKIEGGSASK